jgi:PPK2 family polyphosphate:nucleotide phosphotransferase
MPTAGGRPTGDKTSAMMGAMPSATPYSDLLRLPPGPVDLTSIETDAAPGYDGDKKSAKTDLKAVGDQLFDLQQRLYAAKEDAPRSVLLVLQGMDTSGKGGTLKDTVGMVDPQGVKITSFKGPTKEELAHDFLWRIRKGVPGPGIIGAFDRSHYEDVLIVRVKELAPKEEVERRYGAINDFEAELVESGVSLVKCMLHISPAEQKKRLLARLDDPTKHWKYNPNDLVERARWAQYRAAYEIALERNNTADAPWHVIPADKKWYRNLAVAHLLLETLQGIDPQWPEADFDVEAERQRLLNEAPIT